MSEDTLLRRRGTDSRGRPYLIRPADPEDAEALVALRDAIAAEAVWVAAAPGERNPLEERLALAATLAGGGLALSLEVGGEVVGQLTVARLRGPYQRHAAELSVALAAAHRDRGLGTALVRVALDWARAVAVRRLSLAVFADNLRAIAVYRRCGFAEEGVQRAAVRVGGVDRDLVTMAVLL